LIFKDDGKALKEIWRLTVQNIRETIILEKWNDEDWKVDQMETRILKRLQIKISITYMAARNTQGCRSRRK